MKIISIPFIISIVILSLGMGLAYAHFSNLDAQVILHFNSGGTSTPDKWGSGQDVFLIILSGMLIALINYLLAKALRIREEFLAAMVSVSSIFISSLILIAIFVIISNN